MTSPQLLRMYESRRDWREVWCERLRDEIERLPALPSPPEAPNAHD
jgi:hypothetical protein